MSGEDDFLSRWSRRKQAVAKETDSARPADADPEVATEEDKSKVISDEDWLLQHNLPDPDLLNPGDDFKAFLQANVPAALRQRALRRLWLSNPALANLDGLLDYGDDFTDAAVVPEVLETAYKVGRGIVDKVLDAPEEHAIDTEETNDDAEEQPSQTAAPPASPEELALDPKPDENSEIDVVAVPDFPEDAPAFRPRRMAFKPD